MVKSFEMPDTKGCREQAGSTERGEVKRARLVETGGRIKPTVVLFGQHLKSFV